MHLQPFFFQTTQIYITSFCFCPAEDYTPPPQFAGFMTSEESLPSRKRRYEEVAPELQLHIVKRYKKGQRGCGILSLAQLTGLPHTTVQHVVQRAKSNKGDPVQARGHKERVLDSKDELKICAALDDDGSLRNSDLAKIVENKVNERTISDILARAQPAFSRQRFLDQEPKEHNDEWKREMEHFIKCTLRHVPLKKRIYADESPIFINEALKYGRGRRGGKLMRKRSHYGKKYTLHVYATWEKVLHWELCSLNARTSEIKRITSKVAKKITDEKFLLWDRLGRSGRCSNPTAQHFNPDVIRKFKACGVKAILLPPKGKYLNPVELLFGDLKQNYIRPAFSQTGDKFTKNQFGENYSSLHETDCANQLKRIVQTEG